ncbi:protein APCDD1-like [Periplaneta americana]|uniref:protein APCDD1-like n=1 Tax=Periplaneta americana TaxID=6978 RepID=UPI0037E77D1C
MRLSTSIRTSLITANIVYMACLIGCTCGLLGRSEPILVNSIPNDADDGQCDRLAEEVSRADRDTLVEDPPRLTGKWVSEGCEVRPGPEFLMRSYTFMKNHTFRLLQFHYGDESCTLAQYTLTARGRYRLRGRSWVTPGATEAEYTLTRVTVTAHSAEVAEELATRVNTTCPGQVRRRWKPHRDYVVLSLPEEPPDNNHPPALSSGYQRRNAASSTALARHQLRMMVTEEMDCLAALHAVFHEIQLVRIQRRPRGPPDSRHPRHELLLGDVHSRPEFRNSYRPTAFQTPLLRADQAHGCLICYEVARCTERSPPHLLAKPRLPPYLGGEWVSARCETRPLGLFLTRRLRFHAGDRTWHGEYRFFADPICSVPTFTAAASGRYSRNPTTSSKVEGGTEFDYRVEHASLTVLDRGMAENLQGDSRCIPGGVWKVGVARDLTPSRGCAPLGIIVPSTEYELVRVESDAQGNILLLMGQPDTDNRKRGPKDRPTAYQLPLIRCRSLPPFSPNHHHYHHPDDDFQDNQLFPISDARIGLRSSSARSTVVCISVSTLILIHSVVRTVISI